ncbi:DUF4352 domain-containing protein [Mammaliicoccus sp. Dog046]|uniref:DUF4352 domain-containing protein n=1 Tax=Mammaliicoccus sp. Dog046 TaxID=3034233 RepID=UPI002B258B2B|nr:DUF4352 domain-containing protein [Mammaliicoccus sp. Dog046]
MNNEEISSKEWEEFEKYKNKKKSNKNKWIWGCSGCLVVFIILAIIFGGCVALISDSNSKSSLSSKVNKYKTYKVGDSAKNGDLEVTVNSVEVADQVGPSLAPTKAKNSFVIADITIKNNGTKSLTVDENMFNIKSGDKVADTDTMGSLSASQGEGEGYSTDKSFLYQKINPDSTMDGKIAFDVSDNIVNDDKKKLIIKSAMFSTNKVMFDMNDNN